MGVPRQERLRMVGAPGRSRMRRGLVAAGLVAFGAILGGAATAWILAERAPGDAASEDRPTVPADCLEAIRAARARLLLSTETSEVVTSYARLLRRVVDAVAASDVGELLTISAEARELNRKSMRILEQTRTTDFSTPARRCEELAEQAETPP